MSNISLPFRLLKSYARFMIEGVYYEKTFVQGAENIPLAGTPVLIASSHQNNLNDALGVQFAINDRKPNFIVRGDIFGVHPLLSKFLRSLGLLPAFRLNREGAEAMKQNAETFRASEQELIDGETVVIFPEGGHSNGHWLNTFKSGMAKMAFGAAELANFEKEIYIVPTCNHYSSYYGLRGKLIVRFGEKIPVSQFYELYKVKPHTASRNLTELVHSRIEEMILDEKDKEFYWEMEYLRSGKAGEEFAVSQGYDPSDFEQRFESDKAFIDKFLKAREAENPYFRVVKTEEGMTVEECAQKQIEEQNAAKAKDNATSSPQGEVERTLLEVRSFLSEMKKEKLLDSQFDSHPQKRDFLVKTALLILLLPAAVFCLWPSAVCWLVPKYFSSKAKGLFEGTFLLGLDVLVILPILSLLTLIVVGIRFTLLLAIIYILLFPLIMLFEWYYCQAVKNRLNDLRWFKAEKDGTTAALEHTRTSLLAKIRIYANDSRKIRKV